MRYDLITVGASAGGVEALSTLVAGLPKDLAATLFVVLHTGAHGPSLMAEILNRAGPLPASYPQDGQAFERGQIYLAPPDRHLLLEASTMRVVRGPRENWPRPAIDPLFRSAALQHGTRVVGVVLSGYQSDGAVGLRTIKERGGITVVQDPGDASASEMPTNALRLVEPDHCLPLGEMAALLARLVIGSK